MKGTLRYLLDTDTCIYLLNGESKVKNQIARIGIESLAVASITKGELIIFWGL